MIKIEFLKPEHFVKFYIEDINEKTWKNSDLEYEGEIWFSDEFLEKNDIRTLNGLYYWWEFRPSEYSNYRSFVVGDKIVWNDDVFIVDTLGFMKINYGNE